MDSDQQANTHRPYPSPRIDSIRMLADGPRVTLTCSQCRHTFESYLPTVASVTILEILCPRCETRHLVWPEDFDASLDQCFPALESTDRTELTAEATRITETWYRFKPFADALTVKGVNLGEGAERELIAFVVQGLMECAKVEEGGALG